MKKNKFFMKIILSAMLIFLIISNFYSVFADIDTNKYSNIYQSSNDTTQIFTMSGKILGIVQVIGMGVAVISLSIMGTKYMISSVEEKAKIKEQFIPYVIGAVLLFGGATLIKIVIDFAQKLGTV